jgi:hypothetical protein
VISSVKPTTWHECKNCDGSGILEWGEHPHWVDEECKDHTRRTALWGDEWAKLAVMGAALAHEPELFHRLARIEP